MNINVHNLWFRFYEPRMFAFFFRMQKRQMS